MMKKILNFNEKIKNEITKIDNLYDKIFNKITNRYKINHEKLIIEENDLKDKLKNEVTKAKEKLENYLSNSNELIRKNEKLNKGITILKKNEEKNIIKTLSYISNINKNEKEIFSSLGKLIKNINIS